MWFSYLLSNLLGLVILISNGPFLFPFDSSITNVRCLIEEQRPNIVEKEPADSKFVHLQA